MCHWRAFGQSTPWFQALQKAKAKGFSTQWMDSFWWQIGLPKRPIVMFPKAWMLMLANVPPDRLLAWEMSPRCGGEGFGSWAKGWCLSLTGIRCVEVLVQDAMMMIGSCIILICCNSPRQNMNACCLFSALADGWPVWRRNLRPSGWIATDDFEDSDEPGIYLFRLIFLKIRHCLFGHMLWSTFCREIHCNTGRMHDRYLQYSSLPAVWRLNISFS